MIHESSPDQRWLQLVVLVLVIAQFLPRSAVETSAAAAAVFQPAAAAEPVAAACTAALARRPAPQAAPESLEQRRRIAGPRQWSVPVTAAAPEPAAVQSAAMQPPLRFRPPAADAVAGLGAGAESVPELWPAPKVQLTVAVQRPVQPRLTDPGASRLERTPVTAQQHWQRMLTGKAETVYQRLRADLEQNRSKTPYLSVLAVAALRAERFAEAEVIYRHLLGQDRTEPRWWMGLATAQRGLGTDARPAQQQVLALAAADSVLHRRAAAHLLLARGGGSADVPLQAPAVQESTS